MKHWRLEDVAWDEFDPTRIDPTIVPLVKAAAMVERNGTDYAVYLSRVFHDDPDFKRAADYWSVEEVQHGDALGRWASLADPEWNYEDSFRRYRDGYKLPLDAEASIRGSRTGELIARCMVETGTSSYYTALADQTEEPVLRQVCRLIAADEYRHFKLFYDHMRRYLAREQISFPRRVRIAIGRVTESEDDELAYAFHCSNEPLAMEYDHRRCIASYMAGAMAYYRLGHLERGVGMIFKAIGLNPRGRMSAGAARLMYAGIRFKQRRYAPGCRGGLIGAGLTLRVTADRSAIVLDIVACDDPQARLLHHLTELDAAGDLACQAAVFEDCASRIDVQHVWILHRMQRVYADLGRGDFAFLVASMGARLADGSPNAWPLLQQMFAYYRDRGDTRAAVETFVRAATLLPERPVADRWQIEPLAAAIGRSLDPALVPPSPGARRDHVLDPGGPCVVALPKAVADRLPGDLARLAVPLTRHPTVVAELADAELSIRNDSLVTADRDGTLHLDLSLGPYPHFLRDRVASDPQAQMLTLDEAVVVLDPFPPPNLGHFLLDQISRLGLYRRAGASLDAVVVGARLHPGFQQTLSERASVGRWLFTDIVARVRVGKLFVTTECRELQHPAQLCAPWTITWLRHLLGAAEQPGHRKLFISRADSATRRLVNEPEVLEPLGRHGYEVIVPGEMAYEDQLCAFREASHVVACHGAALAHLVACAPGTHVLEMFHPLYGTWAYAMLAQSCGLRYAAMAGRDGASDAPELNDPEVAGPLLGRFGNRGLRVDAGLLSAWLAATA